MLEDKAIEACEMFWNLEKEISQRAIENNITEFSEYVKTKEGVVLKVELYVKYELMFVHLTSKDHWELLNSQKTFELISCDELRNACFSIINKKKRRFLDAVKKNKIIPYSI